MPIPESNPHDNATFNAMKKKYGLKDNEYHNWERYTDSVLDDIENEKMQFCYKFGGITIDSMCKEQLSIFVKEVKKINHQPKVVRKEVMDGFKFDQLYPNKLEMVLKLGNTISKQSKDENLNVLALNHSPIFASSNEIMEWATRKYIFNVKHNL